MSDVVVKAEGVGKRYRVKAPGEGGYVALRDVLAQGVHGLRDVLRGRTRPPDEAEAFWALRAVDFEIRRGEVVGLIGRNGAGKSTLLKLLSRITEPTEGRITIRGRVASLLEVGTGFHPELTGRENIFLNGAILGMSRAEIRQQFDAIVAFAEVERFLDTPVKRFSSGMYVRLAFAVAAHLRAEILIVDEVLAVGDAEFQARCLGKMGEVAGDGRTVLFVSHNLAAVERLCGSALLLEAGRILEHGPVAPLVQRYLDRTTSNNVHTDARRVRNAGEIIQVTGVDLLVDRRPTRHVKSGDCCTFAIKYTCKSPEILRQSPDFVIEIYLNGQKVTALWSGSFSNFDAQLDTGTVHCIVPRWPLREGAVRINLAVHIGSLLQDWIEDILLFNSHDGPFFGTGPITDSSQGIAFVEHSWLTNQNITSNDLTKIDTT